MTTPVPATSLIVFDTRDAAIRANRIARFDARTGPRCGDFIQMADGRLCRFGHDWGEAGFQVCRGGSFYFGGDHLSYSGGFELDPIIPLDDIIDTLLETQDGGAWFFHHDSSGAGRAVNFTIPCRVYRQKGTPTFRVQAWWETQRLTYIDVAADTPEEALAEGKRQLETEEWDIGQNEEVDNSDGPTHMEVWQDRDVVLDDEPDSNLCPVCGSHEIEGQSVDIEGDDARQEITCLICHAGWTNVYSFARHIEIDGGEAPPEGGSNRPLFDGIPGATEALAKAGCSG